MVAAASIGVSVKTLFIVLYCVMAAAFVYLFMFGDLISCFDIHSRWFILIVADFTAFFSGGGHHSPPHPTISSKPTTTLTKQKNNA
ncbi:hypothetical protein HanPI659440_Chr15g0603911 [Helianthus annuus]|nr:hypothetical protein HanPI659440_Chr15g0603911 [Helianthus annuus]